MHRVGFSVVCIGLIVLLWATKFAEDKTQMAARDIASPDIESTSSEPFNSPSNAGADRAFDAESRERQEEAVTAVGMFGRVSPAEIEDHMMQRIAEQSALEITSLSSVSCDERVCTVAFSGLDVNPQNVGGYSDLYRVLLEATSDDYRPTSGSIGTREISPGAREYVIGITYVALVDASADPNIAARQHAACAGAWARVTEQRGSKDYLRGAHERSEEWLNRSAVVLGAEEAQRIANELRYGPLTRDCYAMPY